MKAPFMKITKLYIFAAVFALASCATPEPFDERYGYYDELGYDDYDPYYYDYYDYDYYDPYDPYYEPADDWFYDYYEYDWDNMTYDYDYDYGF